MRDDELLHRLLDGEALSRPTADSPLAGRMERYEAALERLAGAAERAPADLLPRVLAALPEAPERTWRSGLRRLRPGRPPWLVPALAGALATLVLAVGLVPRLGFAPPESMAVDFEVHAPHAHRVELVGSFTDWQPGRIVLEGPDATGHWSASVRLPAGRYEYLYLVDGQEWVTDPRAAAHRPDGFGRENALIEL